MRLIGECDSGGAALGEVAAFSLIDSRGSLALCNRESRGDRRRPVTSHEGANFVAFVFYPIREKQRNLYIL
jgi:hypothetical protein